MRNLFIILFLSTVSAFAQQHRADSLLKVIKESRTDTNKAIAMNELGRIMRNTNPDSALLLHEQALEISTALNFEHGIASSHYYLVVIFYNIGNYTQAIEEGDKALREWKKIYPPDGGKKAAATLGNLGLVYTELGNFNKALENYFIALRVAEKTSDLQMLSSTQNNIGKVYLHQKNYADALTHFFKAEELNAKLENSSDPALVLSAKNKRAISLGNIGNVFYGQGKYDEALPYYFRSLKLREEMGAKGLISSMYGNIGSLYADKAKLHRETAHLKGDDSLSYRAQEYFNKAMNIAEEIGDLSNVVYDLSNLGTLSLETMHYPDARRYLEKALMISRERNIRPTLHEIYRSLSELDSIQDRPKQALDNYKLFIAYRDSLNNEENTKKAVQLEMNYEFEKKEAAAELEQDKKDAIAAADKKRQNIILLSISGFGLLVLGFAIFAYRSFLQKKKANIEITKQKHLIEEKQKEILDSIYYARRIQRALVTSEKYIERNLKKLRS